MEIAVPRSGTAISRNERFKYVSALFLLSKSGFVCLAWEAVQQGSANRGRWDLDVSEDRLGTDPLHRPLETIPKLPPRIILYGGEWGG